MSEPRKPWEEPIGYLHQAETSDNPLPPPPDAPPPPVVEARVRREDSVFGLDDDDEVGDEPVGEYEPIGEPVDDEVGVDEAVDAEDDDFDLDLDDEPLDS